MSKQRLVLVTEPRSEEHLRLDRELYEATHPRIGYDKPLKNGCYLCIGCGKIVGKTSRMINQCADCAEPEQW